MRSLTAHFNIIINLLHDFDVCARTETWLLIGAPRGHLSVNNYTFLHLYRPRHAGGVAFYAKIGIKFKHISNLDLIAPHMKSMFIEVNTRYVVMYRPERNFSYFLKDFNETFC